MEGLSKTTAKENIVEKPKIKEGVDFVFEQNPELEKIGTKEQYSKYLDTIFPESEVRDIVYHGSRNEFEYFDKSKLGNYTNSPSAKLGIFFASSLDNAKHYTFEGFVKFLEGTEDVSKFKIFREAVIYYKQEAIKDYNNLYNDLRNNKDLSFSLEVDIKKQKLIGRIIETIKKSLNVGYVDKAKKLDELKTIVESQEINLKSIDDKVKEFSELSYKSDYEIGSIIENEELLSKYGKTIVKSIIINSKNPSFYSDNNNSYRHESYVSRIIDSINNKKDGVIIKDTKDPLPTDVYVVFEPEQIHILGPKQDLENFKKFTENYQDSQG